MTSPGGGYEEESQDNTPPFGRAAQPAPWRQYPHAPVDPQATVNYPDYPPQPPPGPPYGYAPPPGYGGPPPYYPVPYDPYHQTCGIPNQIPTAPGQAPGAGAIIACRNIPGCLSQAVNGPQFVAVPQPDTRVRQSR